jgi:sucrose-6-phosphate hydrolase SacC (GH32 family)
MQLLIGIIISTPVKGQYNEKYRPRFHFSPEKGWIGDPDGLVYYDGTYHLFWWGHAVSKDLVHWKELPYPMQGGDGSFSYFSGSVVVDKKNTAGFGANSMIALYTMHKRGDTLPETQGISISKDHINFSFYPANPVLDIRKIFFRDPQVFWHQSTQKWIMVVTVPDMHKIQFYSSKNLKEWIYMSEFGDIGARSAFWECPDLFELNVDGDSSQKKWVLLIGQGPNRVQYFTGNFDGKKFKADEALKEYLNHGTGLPGKVFESFDGQNYRNWENTGAAFGNKPDNADSVVRLGYGDAVSSHNGDSSIGTLSSKPFSINKKVINFLIAGGNHPGETCINLLIDNKIVRSSTGSNSPLLKWDSWDIKEYIGKKAVIQIVDKFSHTGWGYIRIDHILFSDIALPNKLQHALWLDYGNDFYATRSFRFIDSSKSSPVFMGWLGNWEYARIVPTDWGKGFESVPREIGLKNFKEGLRIIQTPVNALKKLRRDSVYYRDQLIGGTIPQDEFKPKENSYEIEVEFKIKTTAVFGLNLLCGEGRKIKLSYNPGTSLLSLDRTNCTDYISDSIFIKKFATRMSAPAETEGGLLKLHILVDQSSIEIFTSGGKTVISALTFPSPTQTGIELFSDNGKTMLSSFKAWELSSIWSPK